MLNVALTGNIASGKSTVVRHFAEWGATVIDADQLVHEAQQPGSPTLAAIVRRFGADVLTGQGGLDREALRRRMLADDAARAALEEIVHPVVRERRAALAAAAEARGDCVLINDIPLLFEALDPAAFDLVVLVDAPATVRRERLCRTRGLSAEEADRLIAAQLPTEPKRSQSDFVIDNAGSLEALQRTAWRAWRTLRARAAADLAAGGGPLFAIVAHPTDAAFAAGGALARYGDAGVEVHLLCATAAAGEARQELERAAQVLGLAAMAVEQRRSTLARDDAQGIRDVAAAIARVRPTVLLTFGADGLDGHPDRVAVHHWVRQAWQQAGRTRRLCCIAYPEDAARTDTAPRRVPRDAFHVQLDIRPWHDVKRAAMAAHTVQRSPFALHDPTAWPPMHREWYTVEPPPPRVLPDLFADGAPRG